MKNDYKTITFLQRPCKLPGTLPSTCFIMCSCHLVCYACICTHLYGDVSSKRRIFPISIPTYGTCYYEHHHRTACKSLRVESSRSPHTVGGAIQVLYVNKQAN